MRQITIQIPEGRYQFILDLLSKFNFVKIDGDRNKSIKPTKEQIDLVDEEIWKINEDENYLLNWDEVKDKFIFK